MFETIIITVISRVIESAGVGTMVGGFIIALLLAIREMRSRNGSRIYRKARRRIGRSILLGLELLVGRGYPGNRDRDAGAEHQLERSVHPA